MSLIVLALAAPLGLMARADNNAPATAATTPPATTAPIPSAPTAAHVTTSKLVYGLLSDSRYAYRPRALDPAMSADIFDRYLEALDSGKLFFTAQDVARFAPYKAKIGESIKNGDAAPAFEMFALYKQRVNQRVDYARGLLKQDIFDFSGSDRWYYDREDAPWAKDDAELDQLWKQSVRNDWLRLKLAGKQPDEIRKTLDKRYANMASNIAKLTARRFQRLPQRLHRRDRSAHRLLQPAQRRPVNQQMFACRWKDRRAAASRDDVVVIREIIAGGPATVSNSSLTANRIVGVGQGGSGPMEDVVAGDRRRGREDQGKAGTRSARRGAGGSRARQRAGADRV